MGFERECALLRSQAKTLAMTMMVGSEKNSSTVRVGRAIVEQKVEILLIFSLRTERGTQVP